MCLKFFKFWFQILLLPLLTTIIFNTLLTMFANWSENKTIKL